MKMSHLTGTNRAQVGSGLQRLNERIAERLAAADFVLERLVPYTVFTDPQVAGVGLSEQKAREQGFEVEVATLPFGNVARAIETDETAGVIQVVVDAKTERILGAFIVGADAGELIHVFSTTMNSGASARTLVDAEFVHPTFAEGLQTALMKLPRYALS